MRLQGHTLTILRDADHLWKLEKQGSKRERFSPVPLEGQWPAGIGPVELISDFWPLNCKRMTLGGFGFCLLSAVLRADLRASPCYKP